MTSTAERVAARFLAAAKRPMKPEKMTELLLKFRKGAWGSLKMEILDQVFAHLGGWVFEDMLYLDPKTQNDDNVSFYSNAHEGNVKTVWEEAKAREVSRLPSNDQLNPADKYKSVFMDVGDIQPSPRPGETGFYKKEWRVVEGTRVKAPNGKVFDTGQSLQGFINNYPANIWSLDKERFTDWLKKDTPFFDQINTLLNLESYEAERAKARTPPRTRANTGTCPCCFGNFKLVPKTRHGRDKTMPGMVLHGYKRPGVGYIHGNCFGQDWPPFELSPEGTVAFIGELEDSLAKSDRYLARLETGEETFFLLGAIDYHKDKMTPHEWERKYAEKIKDQKHLVKDKKEMIVNLKGLVSRWKVQPLPEESEAP